MGESAEGLPSHRALLKLFADAEGWDVPEDVAADVSSVELLAGRRLSGVERASDVEWWQERADQHWVRWFASADLDLPFDVVLRLEQRGGKVVCSGLHLEAHGDAELSARDLRRLRLGTLLGRVGRSETAARAPERHPPRKRGGRRLPVEHYADVAKRYRQALLDAPERPVREVAERMPASTASVHRWLVRARQLGFLDDNGLNQEKEHQ